MPRCHKDGHPWLKAAAAKRQQVAPGTVQNIICANCQRETSARWAAIFQAGGCGNDAARAKAEIMKSGARAVEDVTGAYKAGHWTGVRKEEMKQEGIVKEISVFVDAPPERFNLEVLAVQSWEELRLRCGWRDLNAWNYAMPLESPTDHAVFKTKIGEFGCLEVVRALVERNIPVGWKSDWSYGVNGGTILGSINSKFDFDRLAMGEVEHEDAYQAAHLYPDIDWDGSLKANLQRHLRSASVSQFTHDWSGWEACSEGKRRRSIGSDECAFQEGV